MPESLPRAQDSPTHNLPSTSPTETNDASISILPSIAMPATLFTLPRELRDEIFTYLALSSNFTFLLTCRQLNEEGAPLLQRYGTYHVRALKYRRERLAPPPELRNRAAVIQNLHISMPPVQVGKCRTPNYEIPLRTVRLLEQFGGIETRRRECHLDLQEWTLSERMATVLRTYGGFDIVRVEIQLKPYRASSHALHSQHYYHGAGIPEKNCAQLIEEKLEPVLGRVRWELWDWGYYEKSALVAEFRPRRYMQEFTSEPELVRSVWDLRRLFVKSL